MVAYDLNEPEIVERLVKLGARLKVIIDNSGTHKAGTAAESQAVSLPQSTVAKQYAAASIHRVQATNSRVAALIRPKACMTDAYRGENRVKWSWLLYCRYKSACRLVCILDRACIA